MIIDVVKVILPAALTFLIGIAITPILTDFLYKNRMWKKKSGKVDLLGKETPIFNKLHEKKEVGTPRMGGIVIWASVIIVISIIWLLSRLAIAGTEFFDTNFLGIFEKLDFLSRNQTWIPLAALLVGATVGLIDDLMEIKGNGDGIAGGLSSIKRLSIVAIIGAVVAGWFFFKLDVNAFNLPIYGPIEIGWLIIPLFVAITILIYSGGVIDGLDGLSGGVFATMFAAYAVIAFSMQQINLAAFCAALVGGILAFLWFNIPPARFYMSETGSMALTVVLAIVAFMTDFIGGGVGFFVLPIIAFPLIATAGSCLIQIASRRLRGGKKVFLVAPLHHHFEAIGWPSYKVVMRYWILSLMFAAVGIIFALVV